ncbi:hypothetical protein MGN70_002701 [Eutypa lata]|nr:hypothetical protein MGN70_002701 [Eutypa lata]
MLLSFAWKKLCTDSSTGTTDAPMYKIPTTPSRQALRLARARPASRPSRRTSAPASAAARVCPTRARKGPSTLNTATASASPCAAGSRRGREAGARSPGG